MFILKAIEDLSLTHLKLSRSTKTLSGGELQRLKILNLSLKDFSRISNVPYSTLNNWGFCKDDKTIPVPAWVDSYLMFYEKSKKYDYLANEIFGVMKELEKK